MPIYEYQCEKCGHEFEREQRIVDEPIKTCPSCKARRVKKLISRTSFVLKGSGWYSDLYSSSKKDSPDDKGKGSKDKGEKSDSSSDTKSESKDKPKSDKPKSDKSKGSQASKDAA
jgi:putative FmdB family regulatory protein